ncbi:hypothetical protein ACLOJK_019159, partial [Asimina triloba]
DRYTVGAPYYGAPSFPKNHHGGWVSSSPSRADDNMNQQAHPNPRQIRRRPHRSQHPSQRPTTMASGSISPICGSGSRKIQMSNGQQPVAPNRQPTDSKNLASPKEQLHPDPNRA